MHDESDTDYFKLGSKGLVTEGRVRTTTAILFSSETDIAEPFLTILMVSTWLLGGATKSTFLYALYTMHCILCTVLCELCSMHFNIWLYYLHCILYIALYTLYSMHFILFIVCYVLHSMHCILCIVLYTLFPMYCILCFVFYVL